MLLKITYKIMIKHIKLLLTYYQYTYFVLVPINTSHSSRIHCRKLSNLICFLFLLYYVCFCNLCYTCKIEKIEKTGAVNFSENHPSPSVTFSCQTQWGRTKEWRSKAFFKHIHVAFFFDKTIPGGIIWLKNPGSNEDGYD